MANDFPLDSGKANILIVDDNSANLEVIADYLEEYFEVMTVCDGMEALELVRYAPVDLILLDVMMPGIDGFETCRRLKATKHSADIPVIFMTALTSVEDKVKGFEVGAVDYVTKPIQQRELLARLTTHLQIRAQRQRLEEQASELSQINRDLETMLHVVSHDLKEPLRAIQTFSRLVNNRYTQQLDSKGQDYLQRVEQAAQRLRTLIDDILVLSRAKRMDDPSELVSSNAIVQEILERLERKIKETGVTIRVAPNLPPLLVNSTWATQAIYNLMTNALKYGIPTGYDPTKHQPSDPIIEIVPYHGPEGSGLVVKDRGPGVPTKQAERIFELFYRTVGHNIEGTGAGLAIVRQIAERHGGWAWVRPRKGGGSEFIVTFGGTDQLQQNVRSAGQAARQTPPPQ